jgi:hypothetical protein
VTLRYLDGCPGWTVAHARLRELGVEPELERVESPEDAVRLRFLGSPTILVDGRDPFAGSAEDARYGLTCRLFETPEGLAGSPTVKQLGRALEAARLERNG